MVNRVVCVSMQSDIHLSLSKDGKHANDLQIVADIPAEVTAVLYVETLVAVDDARLEDELCSCLADVDLTPIGHFFDQIDQVDLVL